VGPTATYSWTQPGVYTISITAASPCGGIASTTYTVRVCQPVQQATVSGPNWLLVGDPGTYTAGYLPGNATPPITFTWDSGSEGPTAIYSWSSPGARSVSVTATNLCGLAVSSPYAVTVCQPVTAASISGPPMLWVGKEGTYAAGFLPSNATLPVTFTWDNGTVGPTANYRWYDQGTHTIAVTATNPCGLRVRTTYNVTVCQPVQEVTIQGPVALLAGQAGKYTASYLPLTATLPVALTWNNGTVGPTAWYSWPDPGTHLVVVTATNSCQGEARAVYTVTVGVCRSVDQVTVSGPDMLVVGQDGTYTAGYLPGNATPPITFAWDNGTIGSSAVYGWPSPGMRSIVVTATNPCGERASAPYGVKVCQPVQTVTVSGPTVLKVGQAGTYGAGYSPVTTSLPITITWSNGTVGPTAIYSWPTVGTRMITATVANSCGVVRRSLAVSVWFQIYLPLATWNWNRCHLAPGSFGEVEPNDNPGSANGPLCSDTAYNAQPNDANDYFSFPCGIETVRVRVTNYAPGVHGQLLVYDGEDWICWDSGCEYGVCDCAGSTGDGGTCYARVYTDPLFTSSAWYTLRAIFRGY